MGWAWTAGDRYTEWDGYTIIATETDKNDSPPLWLVHEEYPVSVTTIQPTWSGHMKAEIVETAIKLGEPMGFWLWNILPFILYLT